MTFDLSLLDQHERIAFSFSGGKDSTAVLHMLRDELHRMTVYHVDTGDLLPEMVEHVAELAADIPNFVRIEPNVAAWIAENGLPSDLIPHTQHPVGLAMGEAQTRLVPRYDCCWHNLMWPLFDRVVSDGNTLLIRGTKAIDMRQLPPSDWPGLELWYPLEHWTHADVFTYLAEQGVPLPPIYGRVTNAPECARCTAWWSEARAGYLKEFYPALAREYQARLGAVIEELHDPIMYLQREVADLSA